MHSSQHKFMILCLKQYSLSQILSVSHMLLPGGGAGPGTYGGGAGYPVG